MTSSTLGRQAEALHQALNDLIQRYQFRNRNEICCFDVSVSQCNALEALAAHGKMSVGHLAKQLFLEVSTMSRVLDQLEKKGYIRRADHPDDDRAWLVTLTKRGLALLAKMKILIIAQEEEVLKQIPSASRSHVIRALRLLIDAVDHWRAASCCVPNKLRKVKH